MRYVELLRHTDNDGDALTPEGVTAAEAIGRDLLSPPYTLVVEDDGRFRVSRIRAAREG